MYRIRCLMAVNFSLMVGGGTGSKGKWKWERGKGLSGSGRHGYQPSYSINNNIYHFSVLCIILMLFSLMQICGDGLLLGNKCRRTTNLLTATRLLAGVLLPAHSLRLNTCIYIFCFSVTNF